MMNFKFQDKTISFEDYEKQEADSGLPELYFAEQFIVVGPEGKEIDADDFMDSLSDQEYKQFYMTMDKEIRHYLWYYYSEL